MADTFLLCLPQNIASAVVFNLHNLYGFHFSNDHMLHKLRKIIFSPGLEDLVQDVVSHCPVCTLSPTKKLHRQCGEVRSTVYAPLQAVVCDSLYLPADKLQHSKALLLADSCTIYPEKNENDACLFPPFTKNGSNYTINWDNSTRSNISILILLYNQENGKKSREASPKI